MDHVAQWSIYVVRRFRISQTPSMRHNGRFLRFSTLKLIESTRLSTFVSLSGKSHMIRNSEAGEGCTRQLLPMDISKRLTIGR
jgi:hypothetical protein